MLASWLQVTGFYLLLGLWSSSIYPSSFPRSILVLLNSAASVTQTLAKTTGLLRCLNQGMKGIGLEAEFQSMLAILGLEEQCIPALGHLLALR